MYKNNNKIYGFTLSEVLITLVIIGIVSAITTPVLSALWQKEALKSAFIKAYSDLNGFSRKFYSDYGYSFGEYARGVSYANVISMMMTYYKQGGTVSNDTYGTASADRDSTYNLRLLSGTKLGTATGSSYTICDCTGQFADAAGRLYRFNDKKTTANQGTEINGPIICVDTNGLKGPNRYGYDYFLFIFTVDGRVIPMGMKDKNNTTAVNKSYNFFVSGSDYCKKTGTTVITNAACAYYALADKHPTNSNKSYWKDFL